MFNLLTIAQSYTTLLPKPGSVEWAGACPRCGGVDRFVVNPATGKWFCRVGRTGKDSQPATHPDLWGGDAVDLIRLAERVGYVDASRIITSGTGTGQAVEPVQPPHKAHHAHPFDVAQWSRNLAYCQAQLTPASPQGHYLLARGLQVETWRRFKLGAGFYCLGGQRFESVVIPWHDQAGALVAVAHRLINPPDHKRRYMVAGNKHGHLWGWRAHRGDYSTLFLVEGEINAMSVWQSHGADVLSTGSQNATITPEQVEVINRWATVKLWADCQSVAEKWQTVIGRGEVVRCGEDANELLLQAERLARKARAGEQAQAAIVESLRRHGRKHLAEWRDIGDGHRPGYLDAG